MFLGDGMGPATVTAGRIYSGQLNHQTGEEANLAFDKFPHVALAKASSAELHFVNNYEGCDSHLRYKNEHNN